MAFNGLQIGVKNHAEIHSGGVTQRKIWEWKMDKQIGCAY